MPAPATLTLLLPGLLWPRQAMGDLTRGLDLPALGFLAGRAARHRDVAATWHDQFARHAGLAGPLPFAALRRRAAGQAGTSGDGALLCLDPVHLAFADGRLVLADPALLDLSAGESAALAEALAPTFASFGRLDAGAPGHWHLVLADDAVLPGLPPNLSPPVDAIGDAVHGRIGGSDHAQWWRLLNEAQMLLHAHPVNREREARGKPTVNSLWPWGFSPAAAISERLEALWATARPTGFVVPDTAALAVLDVLAGPRQRGDGLAWRAALVDIERDWLVPALAAWRQRRLSSLDVIVPGADSRLCLHLGSAERWRFWRRPVAADSLA